jgi:hypothetical protein
MAPPTFWTLFPLCLLLSCLGVVELGLVSSIVSYIHLQGPQVWQIAASSFSANSFPLNRIPAHLHLDAGHVSNAAAGLGFFLGLLGIYIAFRERRYVSSVRSNTRYTPLTASSRQATHKASFGTPSFVFFTFVTFAILEFLLAMAALIYSFVYDNMTKGNTISLTKASQEVGQPYTEDNWAPGTWFSAVLALPLESQSDRDQITKHIHVMKASKWMLVPIFIFAFFVMVAGVFGLMRNRRARSMSDERWLQNSRGGQKDMR